MSVVQGGGNFPRAHTALPADYRLYIQYNNPTMCFRSICLVWECAKFGGIAPSPCVDDIWANTTCYDKVSAIMVPLISHDATKILRATRCT